MDLLSEYSVGIKDNIHNKLGFLNKSAPDLSDIIRSNLSLVNRVPPRRKSSLDSSPKWLRVRPVRSIKRKRYEESDSDEDYTPSPKYRVQRKTYSETESDVEELDNIEKRLGLNKRPNQYGSIEGVVVGQWWKTRMECSYAGVHRPPVSGIHAGPDGAYSVALSGGYEGDVDTGDEFTYTGEGGRDLRGTKAKPKNLRTGPQSKDQELTRGNLALHRNFEKCFPVRVVRGFRLTSEYAPEDGYRYDGLYQVVKCWSCIGSAGFLIYKFHFVRCQDQLPLIDSMDNMLLFSSIKKELSRREELKRRKNDSASEESFDEDLEDSNLDPEEENKENSRLFYIEALDSTDMFYKGKFLGWKKAESFGDSAKKFRSVLCKLEDSMNEVNFSGDDVDEMDLDGSFLGWSSAKNGEKNVKNIKNVIDDLEDSLKEEADSKNENCDNYFTASANVSESSTLIEERACRRKPNTPKKVVRFSLEKTDGITYPLAG